MTFEIDQFSYKDIKPVNFHGKMLLNKELSELNKILSNTSIDYEIRENTLKKLSGISIGNQSKSEIFIKFFNQELIINIEKQLLDSRITLIRETCKLISLSAKQLGILIEISALHLLKNSVLSNLFSHQSQPLLNLISDCVFNIIRYVPSIKVINEVYENGKSKIKHIKNVCIKCLVLIIKNYDDDLINNCKNKLEEMIKRYFFDLIGENRSIARKAFFFYYQRFPTFAKIFFENLDSNTQNIIKEEKKNYFGDLNINNEMDTNVDENINENDNDKDAMIQYVNNDIDDDIEIINTNLSINNNINEGSNNENKNKDINNDVTNDVNTEIKNEDNNINNDANNTNNNSNKINDNINDNINENISNENKNVDNNNKIKNEIIEKNNEEMKSKNEKQVQNNKNNNQKIKKKETVTANNIAKINKKMENSFKINNNLPRKNNYNSKKNIINKQSYRRKATPDLVKKEEKFELNLETIDNNIFLRNKKNDKTYKSPFFRTKKSLTYFRGNNFVPRLSHSNKNYNINFKSNKTENNHIIKLKRNVKRISNKTQKNNNELFPIIKNQRNNIKQPTKKNSKLFSGKIENIDLKVIQQPIYLKNINVKETNSFKKSENNPNIKTNNNNIDLSNNNNIINENNEKIINDQNISNDKNIEIKKIKEPEDNSSGSKTLATKNNINEILNINPPNKSVNLNEKNTENNLSPKEIEVYLENSNDGFTFRGNSDEENENTKENLNSKDENCDDDNKNVLDTSMENKLKMMIEKINNMINPDDKLLVFQYLFNDFSNFLSNLDKISNGVIKDYIKVHKENLSDENVLLKTQIIKNLMRMFFYLDNKFSSYDIETILKISLNNLSSEKNKPIKKLSNDLLEIIRKKINNEELFKLLYNILSEGNCDNDICYEYMLLLIPACDKIFNNKNYFKQIFHLIPEINSFSIQVSKILDFMYRKFPEIFNEAFMEESTINKSKILYIMEKNHSFYFLCFKEKFESIEKQNKICEIAKKFNTESIEEKENENSDDESSISEFDENNFPSEIKDAVENSNMKEFIDFMELNKNEIKNYLKYINHYKIKNEKNLSNLINFVYGLISEFEKFKEDLIENFELMINESVQFLINNSSNYVIIDIVKNIFYESPLKINAEKYFEIISKYLLIASNKILLQLLLLSIKNYFMKMNNDLNDEKKEKLEKILKLIIDRLFNLINHQIIEIKKQVISCCVEIYAVMGTKFNIYLEKLDVTQRNLIMDTIKKRTK